MTDQPFILEPTTGFKLMEHLDVQHKTEEIKLPHNVRELKAYHQKLHNLSADQTHTHRKSRRVL